MFRPKRISLQTSVIPILSLLLFSCSTSHEHAANDTAANQTLSIEQRFRDLMGHDDAIGARKLMDQEIAKHPNESIYYAWRADAESAESPKIALEDCKQALAINSKNALALKVRAKVYTILGDLDQALENADAAVRLAPNDGNALMYRGMLLAMTGHCQDGFKDLDRAVQLEPKVIVNYSNRAFLHELRGEHDQALTEVAHARSLVTPATANSIVAKQVSGISARILYSIGKYDDALAECNDAIKSFPTVPRGYELRGQIYDKLGKHDLAAADEKKFEALRAAPGGAYLAKLSFADMQAKVKSDDQ
jgi:tetratricopeptide (TPR) repeat protein